MKFRVQESKFGAPAGVYSGRFLGIQPMPKADPPRIGADGNEMPPGIEWQWEIEGGEHDGKIIGRITGENPTTKNICGTLISGLLGRMPTPQEEIDVEQYKGEVHQVIVGPTRNDPAKTYVTQVVRPKTTTKTAPTPASGKPTRPASAPASAPAKAPAKAPPDRFWIWDFEANEPIEITRAQLVAKLDTLGEDEQSSVHVATLDEPNEWKHPSAFGVQPSMAF